MNKIRTLIRTFPAALLLAGMLATGLSGLAHGQALPDVISTELKVRSNIEVTSAFVTLGDLFDNVGEKSEIRAFRAPAPGQTGYIRASRVTDAATSNGLTWINKLKIPRVNVARLSHFISPEEITASIRNRIMAQSNRPGADGRLDLRFTRPPAAIHLPVTISSGFAVKKVKLDNISGRFSAIVETYAGNDGPARQMVFTGLAVKTIDLPVLNRHLARGEIIRPGDLDLRNVVRSRLTSGALLRVADLIGMASRRSLRAGSPLKARDVEKPRLIHRNDLVTIIYRIPGLSLTTSGKALSDGALGETIPVRNARSKHIVQVTVTGPKTVSPNAMPAIPMRTATSLKAGS